MVNTPKHTQIQQNMAHPDMPQHFNPGTPAQSDRQTALPIVVSIAGSDPSAGAGIQADLKTFAVLGVYGMSIISMLTAQNYRSVRAIEPVSAEMFDAQFRSVFDAYPVASLKIGMIGDERIVEQLVRLLEEYRPQKIVFDPVLRSSVGPTLSDPAKRPHTLFAPLLPWIDLLTPNIPEAAALLNRQEPTNDSALIALLPELSKLECRAVLLKGGHGTDSNECVDRLLIGSETHEFRHPRVNTAHLHGTGCTLSSAIASFLARGLRIEEAVEQAISFTLKSIQGAERIGISAFNGPLNHFDA